MIDYRARIEEAIQRVEAKSFELSSIITDLNAQHDRLIAARSVLDDIDMIFGRQADTSSPEPDVPAASDTTVESAEAAEQTVRETQSTAARKDVRVSQDTGASVPGGPAEGEGLDATQTVPLQTAGTQAPPVDTQTLDDVTVVETVDASDPPGTAPAIGGEQHGPQVLPDQSSGNEGGSAGREHSSCWPPSESTASVPDDETTAEEPPEGEAAAPSVSPKRTLRERIRELHRVHPEYTNKQAVEALKTTYSSLSAYSSILKIKWASAKEVAEAREPADAPSHPEPAESPPAITPAAPIDIASRKLPPGTLFRLTDGNGLYLHQSCMAMTAQVQFAWIGPADKLLAVRRKFDLARDLSERVVMKSTRAA